MYPPMITDDSERKAYFDNVNLKLFCGVGLTTSYWLGFMYMTYHKGRQPLNLALQIFDHPVKFLGTIVFINCHLE